MNVCSSHVHSEHNLRSMTGDAGEANLAIADFDAAEKCVDGGFLVMDPSSGAYRASYATRHLL